MKKNIVITGGNDGLGKAIAKQLINNNIIIISKDEERLINAYANL